MEEIKLSLEEKIRSIIGEMSQAKGVEIPEKAKIYLERPKREGQGDWACSAALQLGKVFGLSPRDLAQQVADRLAGDPLVSSVEVAGPGFINMTLSQDWIGDLIKKVLEAGPDYGRVSDGGGKKVQVEFVSANPTGPLHMGHGRGAAVGDITSSILSYAGWQVEREYYINDAGLQMELLGRSARSRYFELLGRPDEAPFPEDGYHGDYIMDIANEILEEKGTSLADMPEEEAVPIFTDLAYEKVLRWIKRDLEDFGLKFDVWFSERSLYVGDQVERTIEALKARGYAYEADGAVWFKSTAFGDEKDRVLIRSNGAPTYFMSDVVYHKNKYDRGFDLVIDVWGADHHGYIPRMKSAVAAMGRDPEDLQVLLIQFVTLLRDGEPVSMSKRAGAFVTLRDVMDEVGVDATRFFFVMRRCDSHLDFDLELAKRASSDNPVYYIQYAHARMCSIERESEARGLEKPSVKDLDPGLFKLPEEVRLATVIAKFPEEIRKAARDLAPHRMAYYAQELSEAFHSFYNVARIIGEEEPLRRNRTLLMEAARVTLRNVLGILGVKAPERM
ncbi:arginyl-tRNA synthetase [Thermanaerovibrio velox DSM 12556]|uniref:Arginine--tRNA ligase n=1 Tax=Thermanaerovibrio velox DSM 12556 TaxID=926567 RepID=H0USI5_9BACT|nr:arginine--tRNA ligase [Thermanaerovibrio velox]EHM10274.1 arginyl-tRNA synthetase [Thermanaerovibrio velox DSM 12556]